MYNQVLIYNEIQSFLTTIWISVITNSNRRCQGCKYTHNFVVNSKANGLDVRGTGVIGCAGNTGEVAVSVYDNTGGVIREGQYISVYHEGMQIPYGAAGGQVTILMVTFGIAVEQ